jgi:hypothetical protein
MTKKPNKSIESNRRHLFALAANQRLGGVVHTLPPLSAAVAHLKY